MKHCLASHRGWSLRGRCCCSGLRQTQDGPLPTQKKWQQLFSRQCPSYEGPAEELRVASGLGTNIPLFTKDPPPSPKTNQKKSHFLSVNMALTSHSRFLIWSISTFISWFFWRTFCKSTRQTQIYGMNNENESDEASTDLVLNNILDHFPLFCHWLSALYSHMLTQIISHRRRSDRPTVR